jgi:hypothetical protein
MCAQFVRDQLCPAEADMVEATTLGAFDRTGKSAIGQFHGGMFYTARHSDILVLVLQTAQDSAACKDVLDQACANGYVMGYTGAHQADGKESEHRFSRTVGDASLPAVDTRIQSPAGGASYTVSVVFAIPEGEEHMEYFMAVAGALNAPTKRHTERVTCRACYLGEDMEETPNQEGMGFMEADEEGYNSYSVRRRRCRLTLNGIPIPVHQVLTLEETPNCSIEVTTAKPLFDEASWWSLFARCKTADHLLASVDSNEKLLLNAGFLLQLLEKSGEEEAVVRAAQNILANRTHIVDDKLPGDTDNSFTYAAPLALRKIMACIRETEETRTHTSQPMNIVREILNEKLGPPAYIDAEWPIFYEAAGCPTGGPYPGLGLDTKRSIVTFRPGEIGLIANSDLWLELLRPVFPTVTTDELQGFAIIIAGFVGTFVTQDMVLTKSLELIVRCLQNKGQALAR